MPSTLTIFLLSGNPDAIRKAANETASWTTVDVQPFEEKWITSSAKVRDQLQRTPSSVVAFGCKDLDLQRFQVALTFYLLIYGPRARYLLDESARVIHVTWTRFLVVDLIRFVVEVVVSAAVLLHATIRLPGLKRRAEPRL